MSISITFKRAFKTKQDLSKDNKNLPWIIIKIFACSWACLHISNKANTANPILKYRHKIRSACHKTVVNELAGCAKPISCYLRIAEEGEEAYDGDQYRTTDADQNVAENAI